MPEWGPDGGYPYNTAGYNWNRPYRDVVGPNSVAQALAARLSGLMPAWKHPAFFDYYDRYYEKEKGESSNSTSEIKPFVKNMWEAYRNTTPPSSNTFTISVSKSGTGTGIVSGTGINCGTDCSESYATSSNTSITLTATPSAGSVFAGWSGACTGTNTTCTVSMTSDKSVTATFTQIPVTTYTLTTSTTGTGAGTITGNTSPYTSGTTATLTATPSADSVFAGWSGACTGTGSCVVTMDGNKTVTATFNTQVVVTNPAPIITSPTEGYVFSSRTKSITVKWTGSTPTYVIKVVDLTDPAKNTKTGGTYVYRDNYTSTSLKFSVTRGHAYKISVSGGSAANPTAEDVVNVSVRQ
jgi:uncharacterized repeat protein (TIGR02543 family)